MIDNNLDQPWPEPVVEALSGTKQGDLVPLPPFYYAANTRFGIWSVTRPSEGEEGSDEDLIEIDPADRPPYGIITTQTCDLREEDRKRPREPWFQVAPVYDASDQMSGGQDGLVTAGRVGHLIKLTSSALPAGFWVADLRIEIPLEKSWLVGKSIIAGFDSENDFVSFSRRLAGRRERAALGPSLMNGVVIPLKNWLDGMKPGEAEVYRDPVTEIRLLIAGDRIENPDAVRLIVVADEEALEDHVKEAWDEWWDNARSDAERQGITLLANDYHTMDTLSARRYSESVALDFRYLSD